MATTGMRRGEVLGLQWDEVDLDHYRVSVVRSLVAVTYGEVVLSEPKTAKGRRSVALDPATVAALESHRQAQRAERDVAGELWRAQGFVFCKEDGSTIHPHRFTAWFEQRGLEASLPRIRLHDLRHSYASAALAAGDPRQGGQRTPGPRQRSDHLRHLLPRPTRPAGRRCYQGRRPHIRRRMTRPAAAA